MLIITEEKAEALQSFYKNNVRALKKEISPASFIMGPENDKIISSFPTAPFSC